MYTPLKKQLQEYSYLYHSQNKLYKIWKKSNSITLTIMILRTSNSTKLLLRKKIALLRILMS